MEKLHIDRVIVLEGKYDKIKLSSVTDAMIITTDGFGVFNDQNKKKLISRLAQKNGLIVLSDSDGAGLLIRNYIKSFVHDASVINLYIPSLPGKEKRKKYPSKEGTLGVEGMQTDLLYRLLQPFDTSHSQKSTPPCEKITKLDLFQDGFSGSQNSTLKRRALLRALGLPENLSSSALVDAVNALGGKTLYDDAKKNIKIL